MKITNLDQLLEDELKDIYSAENQLLKALPRMAEAAESKDLRASFEKHLEQTQTHVQRIEEICRDLKVEPSGKTCPYGNQAVYNRIHPEDDDQCQPGDAGPDKRG